MKKTIFGSTLILSGVIGFVGWSIACTQTVQPGAKSRVLSCVKGEDWVVFGVFIVIVLIGLIVTLRSFKEPN